jgi:hypothetical protein
MVVTSLVMEWRNAKWRTEINRNFRCMNTGNTHCDAFYQPVELHWWTMWHYQRLVQMPDHCRTSGATVSQQRDQREPIYQQLSIHSPRSAQLPELHAVQPTLCNMVNIFPHIRTPNFNPNMSIVKVTANDLKLGPGIAQVLLSMIRTGK